jgi:hypothetical protein
MDCRDTMIPMAVAMVMAVGGCYYDRDDCGRHEYREGERHEERHEAHEEHHEH